MRPPASPCRPPAAPGPVAPAGSGSPPDRIAPASPQAVHRRFPALLLLVALLLVAAGCGGREGRDASHDVVVFAAASLRDALVELAPAAERETGLRPVHNFAGSNVLARQVEAAPAADVYLSAHERWVDHLEGRGRLVPGSRRTLLSNRLVVVAHPDSPLDPASPAELAAAPFRHLALGDPAAVPAGLYARHFMDRAVLAGDGTLWSAVEERVVPTADVRAALALVEARRDTLGVVYATDAAASDEVRVLFTVPAALVPPIRYVGAAVAGGPAGEGAARELLAFLAGPVAQRVFRRHGFLPPPGEGAEEGSAG